MALLRPVHERDGYPLRPVHLHAGWLYDGLDRAWVAESAGRIVGHIAADVRADGWHVTRFFVGVDDRGSGAGTALLEVLEACARADSCDLWLDVVEHNLDAQRLYESRGWLRIATIEAPGVGGEPPYPLAFTYRLSAGD